MMAAGSCYLHLLMASSKMVLFQFSSAMFCWSLLSVAAIAISLMVPDPLLSSMEVEEEEEIYQGDWGQGLAVVDQLDVSSVEETCLELCVLDST